MKPTCFEIFKIFFITGLQLVGGGYVILPLLKKYLVNDKKWMTEEELIDYLALSQCLPGIIALNISVFTGYKLNKIKGAICAVFGLILPSFLIILVLAGFISRIENSKLVEDIFFGVRLSIIVLIFYMIYDIFKKSVNTVFSISLFLFVLLAGHFLKFSPTLLVIISVLIAIGTCKKK